MCKSTKDGGRRCVSHTNKEMASVLNRIRIQEKGIAFLEQRKQAAGGLTTKQEKEMAERKSSIAALVARAHNLTEALNTIEKEQTARAAHRQAANEARERKRLSAPQRNKFSSQANGRPRLNLTAGEYADLKQQASQEGKSVSKYVSELLKKPINFIPRKATLDLKRIRGGSSEATVGRKPQSNEATITQSPSVKLDAEQATQLSAEAEAFELTTADYLRRRILNQDPRTRGSHMSLDRQEAEIARLSFYEDQAGLKDDPTLEELQAVYTRKRDEILTKRSQPVQLAAA